MRLLLLTNLYPPQNLGGFGLCLERLCRGLEQLGYTTQTLTSDSPYLGRAGLNPNVCRALELIGSYEGGISQLTDNNERYNRCLRNRALIAKVAKSFKPNTCLIGNLDLLGVEIIDSILDMGIPVIQHVGFMGAPLPVESKQLKNPLYRMAFASGQVKLLLKDQGFKVDKFPVVYPPLANDISPPMRKERNGNIRVCYSGLLMQSKGVHILFEALAILKLKNIFMNLSVAGKAFAHSYEDELRDYAIKAGINTQIKWFGFMESEELQKFYEAHDVLVFPSLHPESFGMVVAEAMATGVVPISSGVGGAIEVIAHGRNGLLVPPGDSNALANQLIWCNIHREELEKMAKNARRDSIKMFTPRRSAEILNNCFMEMLGK
jgi:glycosyltransferase involved in cell wall biosynthesis